MAHEHHSLLNTTFACSSPLQTRAQELGDAAYTGNRFRGLRMERSRGVGNLNVSSVLLYSTITYMVISEQANMKVRRLGHSCI